MIIFFSGGNAETYADRDVQVMTTFFTQRRKTDKRILRLQRRREKEQRKKTTYLDL